MKDFETFIGLDVHKETIVVAGLSDSTASFTADSLNSAVYDFAFFSDI